MADYKGTQSVLDNILGDYHQQGFCLAESDTSLLRLYHEGEWVATFSQLEATVLSLQEVCRKHLDSHQ